MYMVKPDNIFTIQVENNLNDLLPVNMVNMYKGFRIIELFGKN